MSDITALVIAKGDPHPPLLTLCVSLAQAGHRVLFAPSHCRPQTRQYLEQRGVTVQELQPEIRNGRNVAAKLQYWWTFRQRAWRVLDDHPQASLVWIASADSAIAMGRGLWQRKYVLQLHELYDDLPFYRKNLKGYCQHARAIVVPELGRAAIFRSWYGLDRTPYVLPNKPLEHPRTRGLPVQHAAAKATLNAIPAGTKIVMYQGIIHRDRDLRPVGQAVQSLGPGWAFVVVGSDEGFLAPLQQACPQMIHIPYVAPPEHLQVTSHATIGVLAYCFDNLNNVFCAPNKTWEYSGFGLPMLGNDVPGLKMIADSGAGLCVDFLDPAAVTAAIRHLAADEDQFRQRSAALYDSCELTDVVRQITERVAA
jgi:glycosyltransferase involved in cell wall biosynthesis